MGLNEMFAAEDAIYQRSLAFVRTNGNARKYLEVIEVSLDVMLSMAVIPQDTEDARTIAAISARVTNTTAGCLREAMNGYIQNSLALMRDLVETQTLLDYFSHDPAKIATWRTDDAQLRQREFKQWRMRDALDKRDGFTTKKRAEQYAKFCEYGTHVTYPGLRLLLSEDRKSVTPGPRWLETQFINCLFELANRVIFCTVTLTPLLSNDTPDNPVEAARLAGQVERLRKMVVPVEGGDGSTSV